MRVKLTVKNAVCEESSANGECDCEFNFDSHEWSCSELRLQAHRIGRGEWQQLLECSPNDSLVVIISLRPAYLGCFEGLQGCTRNRSGNDSEKSPRDANMSWGGE